MLKIKLQKIVRNLLDIKLRKLASMEYHLEIFSRPPAIENSWQYLLLRTDILQKQSFGVPRKLVRFIGVRSHGTTLTV